MSAQDRGEVPKPERRLPTRAIEVTVSLQLHSHPDTAHRRIDVNAEREAIVLSGTVATESERNTAGKLAGLAAVGQRIDNRLVVKPDAIRPADQAPADPTAKAVTRTEVERQFQDRLSRAFPAEMMRHILLTAYPVEWPASAPASSKEARPQPSAERKTTQWVVVAEGTIPDVGNQLAIDEALLSGSPAAAAVMNRTFVAAEPIRVARRGVQFRVPLIDVGVGLGIDRGVDFDLDTPLGPLGLRAQGRSVPAEDSKLVEDYLGALHADEAVKAAPIRCFALGQVLTIEGRLRPAERMRAIALARHMPGVRGIVDKTETIDGTPAYFHEQDLEDFLSFRLSEHSGARDVQTEHRSPDHIKVRSRMPTAFHTALAGSVIAQDRALARLPLELDFTEDVPQELTVRADSD